MPDSAVTAPTAPASAAASVPVSSSLPLVPLVILIIGLASMFLPSYFTLAETAWQKDENGHGPFIIALAFWLLWSDRHLIFQGPAKPAPITGWALLIFSIACYILGRSQGLDTIEVGSHILLLASCLLILRGWQGVRRAWFALFFLLFMVPLPGVVVQAITMPLKIAVSVVAEYLLHLAHYPIGRSGVTLVVGQYQMMVADACAGLNSLFTLEALGVFYMKLMNYKSKARNVTLALLILPISFAANVIRVLVLVLVTYHMGDGAGQGFLHGFAGMVLFSVALALTYSADRLLAARFDNNSGQRGA